MRHHCDTLSFPKSDPFVVEPSWASKPKNPFTVNNFRFDVNTFQQAIRAFFRFLSATHIRTQTLGFYRHFGLSILPEIFVIVANGKISPKITPAPGRDGLPYCFSDELPLKAISNDSPQTPWWLRTPPPCGTWVETPPVHNPAASDSEVGLIARRRLPVESRPQV